MPATVDRRHALLFESLAVEEKIGQPLDFIDAPVPGFAPAGNGRWRIFRRAKPI